MLSCWLSRRNPIYIYDGREPGNRTHPYMIAMRWTIQSEAQKRRYPAAGRTCMRWGRVEVVEPVIALSLLLFSPRPSTDCHWGPLLQRPLHSTPHYTGPLYWLSTIWKQSGPSQRNIEKCFKPPLSLSVKLTDTLLLKQCNNLPSDNIAKSRPMTN